MRKILNLTSLFIVLSFISIKPANALIIDPTSLAQKVVEWVGKIEDATGKIQQQVEQAKLKALQGFKKDFLADIAQDYLKDYAVDFAKKQMKLAVKNSKDKEKKNLGDSQKFYDETTGKYYEAKEQMIKEQIEEAQKTKEAKKIEENQVCNVEIPNKLAIYETLKSSYATHDEIVEAEGEYLKAEMKCEELKLDVAQAEDYIKQLEASLQINTEEKSKVGTSADPIHKEFEDRINALEASPDEDVEIGAKNESIEDWDNKKALDAYQISPQEYVDFINKYFINDNNITEGVVSTQTEMDRVMRDRRRLLVNSSIHLLQVSASIRRDIPTKTEKIKEMYDEVRKTEDEFKAIGYYSGSKIDNIRALVLYAKILSTKLQYMAAKDLLIVEPRRRGRAEEADSQYFDLSKYKLTDSYIKAIEEESNKGIDLHQGVE